MLQPLPFRTLSSVLVVLLAAASAVAAPRVWFDHAGTQVEADLVEIDGSTVVLDPTRGEEIAVPLHKMSRDDLRYLREAGHLDHLDVPATVRIYLKRVRLAFEGMHDTLPGPAKDPRLGLLLLVASLLLIVLSEFTLVIKAFGRSIPWGLGCLVIPGLALVYAAVDWTNARVPVLWLLVGLVCLVAGLISLPEPNVGRIVDLLVPVSEAA